MALDPTNPISCSWLGVCLAVQRRFEEGLAAATMGTEIDPLSSYAHVALAWTALLAGENHQAHTACRRALEITPDFALAHAVAGLAHARTGSPGHAVAKLEAASQLSDRAAIYLGWLGWGLAVSGKAESARAILDELAATSAHSYVSPLYSAWIRLGLGEADSAFELLERSREVRDPQLVYLDHPQYDALRSDPRFSTFRQRLTLDAR